MDFSNVDEVVNYVSKKIEEACSHNLFDLDMGAAVSTLDYQIKKIVRQVRGGWEKSLGFDCRVDSSTISFIPKNLFSLLVLNNIYVDPSSLEGKESYETDGGTFIFKDCEAFFVPKKPLEYIVVDFTIPGEEK